MKLSQLALQSFQEGYIVSVHPETKRISHFSSIAKTQTYSMRDAMIVSLDWTACFDVETGELKGVLSENKMNLIMSDLQFWDDCDGCVKVAVPEKETGFKVLPLDQNLPHPCRQFLDGPFLMGLTL